MEYITEHALNLSTGEPFSFEVSDEKIEGLERRKKMVEEEQRVFFDPEELVPLFEFSLFPAFEDLLNIFFGNGFSVELLRKILEDFGVEEESIQRLLQDSDYIAYIKPWFEGITCDGSRAARTLVIVHRVTKRYLDGNFVPAVEDDSNFIRLLQA